MRREAGIGAAPEADGLASLGHAADVRDLASARQEACTQMPAPKQILEEKGTCVLHCALHWES